MQAMPDSAGQKNMKRKGSPVKIQVDFNCLHENMDIITQIFSDYDDRRAVSPPLSRRECRS